MQKLKPQDSAAFERLYRASFAQFPTYYGQVLPRDYLEQRVFSSELYATDLSVMAVDSAHELGAGIIANLRQHPQQLSRDCAYINFIAMKPDTTGRRCAQRLLRRLIEASRIHGLRRMITSMQWAGIWPGILTLDRHSLRLCEQSGAHLLEGEYFVAGDIAKCLSIAKRRAPPSDNCLHIRQFQTRDRPSLEHLLRTHFSLGWRFETLSKIDRDVECFNGYGLALTYRPEDVFVLSADDTIQGFCVVQSLCDEERSFFGPIGIAPELRGQGFGLLLLVSALTYLQGRNKKTFGLWTSQDIYNGFYKKLGLNITMQTQHAYWSL